MHVLFHHYIITGADQPAGGLQRGADQPGVLRHGRHQHRGQLRPRHQPHRNLLRHYTTSNLYLETFIHYLYLETWLPLTLTCTTTEDLTKSRELRLTEDDAWMGTMNDDNDDEDDHDDGDRDIETYQR